MQFEPALDRLSALGSPMEAEIVARDMDASAQDSAAAMHASALVGLVPMSADASLLRFANFTANLAPGGTKGDIVFDDVERSYSVEGVRIEQNDGPARLSDLMTLLQFARDRADTLVMQPSARRSAIMKALAAEIGASVRFVSFILQNYNALSKTIAK